MAWEQMAVGKKPQGVPLLKVGSHNNLKIVFVDFSQIPPKFPLENWNFAAFDGSHWR
jgi:hypothetical protein